MRHLRKRSKILPQFAVPGSSARKGIAISLSCIMALGSTAASFAMPTGVFLWYPENQIVPSSADCDALVARLKPTVEKAEAWYFGRAPLGSALEFYLFLDDDRMEPTFSAEGDYDLGTLRNVRTQDGETTFDLTPDDHPSETISGSILAPEGSSVVTVILRDVPSNGSTADRTTHYCRFGEEIET